MSSQTLVRMAKVYSEFLKSVPMTDNHVKFARFVLLPVSKEAKTWDGVDHKLFGSEEVS